MLPQTQELQKSATQAIRLQVQSCIMSGDQINRISIKSFMNLTRFASPLLYCWKALSEFSSLDKLKPSSNLFRLFTSIIFLCQILFLASKTNSYFAFLVFISLTHLLISQSTMSFQKLLFYGSWFYFINVHFHPLSPSSLFLYFC